MNYEQLYLLISKDPKRWKIEDVSKWLNYIGLNQLIEKFISNQIDGSLLTILNESDFQEIGMENQQKEIQILMKWISTYFQEYSNYLKNQGFPQKIESDINNNILIQEEVSQLTVSNQFNKSLLKVINIKEEEEIYNYQSNNQDNNLILTNIIEQKEYLIKQQEITIGRNYDNSIVLTDDYISRQHCIIYYSQDNQNYYLQDIGSSQGTFVKLINPTLLAEKYIIQLGTGQYSIEKIQIYGLKCSVQIKVLEGELINKTFDFELTKDKTSLIFGRQFIQFSQDTHLSNQHAQFIFTDDGLIIEDLNSLNGTWLRLSYPQMKSEPLKLINGRSFRLGLDKLFKCRITN